MLSRHVFQHSSKRTFSTVKHDALKKLTDLRATMKVDALIIPTEDAHQSEYTAECDNRRSWISGFTGSAGCAIVTKEKAALFTDGRYFLQATKELDSKHWQLMKQGLPGVPTWQEYLIQNMPSKSTIGIDPSVITMNEANALKEKLNLIESELIYVKENPVDQIRQDRPERPSEPIHVHPIEYAGKSVKSKLKELYENCNNNNIIISLLDEIAWLLNLRGSDIHCSPVFFSYMIVTKETAVLYIQPSTKLTSSVKNHLKESGVQVKDYNAILNDLKEISHPFLIDPDTTNMSILQSIQNKVIGKGPSFISLSKAIKNESELNGIRNCHKRDAVALCKHFSWLHDSLVNERNIIKEYEAATHLQSMRQLDSTFIGISFDTIAATGSNGAIIHYQPHETESDIINPNHIYLCDSGAHYIDGTTDITRTFLFQGEPTEFQKRAYTRVLQCHIAIDEMVFPQGTTGYQLDSIGRVPLWKDGLNFRHGIGHGVGAYLNVHEGPHGIGSRLAYNKIPLQQGMVVTNEPGYYEDDHFGIRLENIMIVNQQNTMYKFSDINSLGFEHVTFVPFDTRLIDKKLLSQNDIKWINSYHQECRTILEPLLLNDYKTLSWIERETEPL